MKLGIIGKPQSGKTTVFNAASGQQEAVGDFSQAVHRAIIKVPDERVDQLAEIVKPKKITYAEVEFLDAPGFTGKGKETDKFELNPEIRFMEALMMVVDAFSEEADPAGDIQALIDEMILADMTVLENNITKKRKKIKVTGDKAEAADLELLQKCYTQLEEEKLLIDLDLDAAQEKSLRGYTFLTQKPLLIVLNLSEDKISSAAEIEQKHGSLVKPGKCELVALCGKMEAELVALEDEERAMFMSELGIESPAVERVIQKSYALLGLISYLTAGEPEVRAWTIKRGTVAQKAAGVIHSDIERGFIRAEVTAFADYMEHKTPAALKAAGKSRLEGKEYTVCDGDVILFRFNV
ncbi:MAG: DUF933 domain-containing protein [bacterium]|nr:DUF933 domain-containing protein [bacterium]